MLLYLLEERVVQEGAGTRSGEKGGETGITPSSRFPNSCGSHLIARAAHPSLGSPRNSQRHPRCFLANPVLILLGEGSGLPGEPRLFLGSLGTDASSPTLPSPPEPPKVHSQPRTYTLHPGCAEGTAPQSGGSGARRCGDRGGRASRHWRSWGCWWPGFHSGQGWPLSAGHPWSAPQRGWCWCPADRAQCRSASPAASGGDRPGPGLEGTPERPREFLHRYTFPIYKGFAGSKERSGRSLTFPKECRPLAGQPQFSEAKRKRKAAKKDLPSAGLEGKGLQSLPLYKASDLSNCRALTIGQGGSRVLSLRPSPSLPRPTEPGGVHPKHRQCHVLGCHCKVLRLSTCKSSPPWGLLSS